jgi:hypothetical protein
MLIDGTYEITVQSPMGERKTTLVVKSNGDRFSGTNSGAMGTSDIEGRVEGNTLTWSQKMTTPIPITLEMKASVEDDKVEGSVRAGMMGTFPLSGVRVN